MSLNAWVATESGTSSKNDFPSSHALPEQETIDESRVISWNKMGSIVANRCEGRAVFDRGKAPSCRYTSSEHLPLLAERCWFQPRIIIRRVRMWITTKSKLNEANTLHLGQTKPLMFSTTPTIGTFTFRQKFTSFRTSNNDTSYNNNNNVSSHTRTGVPRDLPEVLSQWQRQWCLRFSSIARLTSARRKFRVECPLSDSPFHPSWHPAKTAWSNLQFKQFVHLWWILRK